MDETRERIQGWSSRPVEGDGGMARLADAEFTGALVEDDDVLFLLNGRVVGTTGRSAETFTGGTAYQAPGPALPLLFAMRERGGETTTQGYTNDTPLHEVDATLQESNFTGYVELSENVLSGDYYLVYYGGRPLYAAFVGASSETIVGDEAFERADDEVGIYEVVTASIDVSELPTDGSDDTAGAAGVTAGAGAAASAGASAGAAAGVDGAAASDDGTADTDESGDESEPVRDESSDVESDESASDAPESSIDTGETDAADASDSETVTETGAAETATPPEHPATDGTNDDGSNAPSVSGDAETDTDSAADAPNAAEPADTDTDESAGAAATRSGAKAASPETDAGASAESRPVTPRPDTTAERTTERAPTDLSQDPGERSGNGTEPTADDTVFDAEAEWRETTSIPALDPDESEGEPEDEPAAAEPSSNGSDVESASAGTASPGRSRSEGNQQNQRDERNQRDEPVSEREQLVATLRERTEKLETRTEQLSAAKERVETLESEREALSAEREELEGRVEALESKREELREAVETLESDLESARRNGPASVSASENEGPALSRARALGETNLFVRYDSKSKPTLESVADGATPEEVRANLRLNDHTQFDDEHATVDGEPFSDFLRDTPEYAFVEWAVTVLPFEIRDTGHESGLADLYEALPAVDRAELGGTVEVETEEGEVERRDFDVVLRDKMGDALVVADINAARDPVSGAMMTELVESATAVAEHADIGAALYVTESFFEPDALEAAEESTGGGLLSRSSKESYVRTGRKQGYHLCLAESRDGSFYVTVPEL